MDQTLKSLTIREFWQKFADDDACKAYIASIKWQDGFTCVICGHDRYCNGYYTHDRQCTRCRRLHSPTSGTLFHKVKFGLQNAFYIVYVMSTAKKGTTSTQMSRDLGIKQPTCWRFMKKVRKAMSSSKQHPMKGEVEVDEMVVGGEETGTRGRKNLKKKLTVVGIEKKGKGVSRFYSKRIEGSNSKELGAFFTDHIDKQANVRTDGWTGYLPLKKDYANMERDYSGKKGANFNMMHRCIMMFKAWLRGVHHHVNDLQAYLDEYSYRYNRHLMGKDIFENLMKRMVSNEPYLIKNFVIY